jgi:hypothetical protein
MRRPSSTFNVNTVLHATIKVIEDQGGKFVSAQKSRETGDLPTSHFVIQKLQSVKNADDLIDPKNQEEVQAIIKHYKESPAVDDFATKVKEILTVGVVSERMIAFIVALPHMYSQKKDRIVKLAKIADKYTSSTYIGEIGQREEFFVKLVETQEFVKTDPNTGVTQNLRIYKVADQLGNYGYFFAKAGSLADAEGKPIVDLYDCFLMKATPKNHAVGRTGIKETQFSRVRIVQNIGKGSEE